MFVGFHISCAPIVFCLFGSQDRIISNFCFITLQSHTIDFIIAESCILQSGEIFGVY